MSFRYVIETENLIVEDGNKMFNCNDGKLRFRIVEDSPWKTGSPTEEDCYIVYYWDYHNPLGVMYEAMCDVMVQPVFDDDGELECWVNDDRSVRFEADDVIRWQRIEPYKEANNGWHID